MVNVRAKRIFCVVAYDVQDDKQRNKVAKLLEKYGVRINYSVFECMFTSAQMVKVQAWVNKHINLKHDMVVFYTICVDCYTKIAYYPQRKISTDVVVIT